MLMPPAEEGHREISGHAWCLAFHYPVAPASSHARSMSAVSVSHIQEAYLLLGAAQWAIVLIDAVAAAAAPRIERSGSRWIQLMCAEDHCMICPIGSATPALPWSQSSKLPASPSVELEGSRHAMPAGMLPAGCEDVLSRLSFQPSAIGRTESWRSMSSACLRSFWTRSWFSASCPVWSWMPKTTADGFLEMGLPPTNIICSVDLSPIYWVFSRLTRTHRMCK